MQISNPARAVCMLQGIATLNPRISLLKTFSLPVHLTFLPFRALSVALVLSSSCSPFAAEPVFRGTQAGTCNKKISKIPLWKLTEKNILKL
eukprot:2638126-Rhodomonas_salina.3